MRAIIRFFLISINITSAFLTSLSAAEKPQEFDTIVTNKGKTYHKVKVNKITPAGISILHEAGAATIPYENLSKELQEHFGGFDQEAAMKYKQQENELLQAYEQKLDAAIAVKKQKDKIERLNKELDQLKRPTCMKIHQIIEGGALGKVSFLFKNKVKVREPRTLGGYNIVEKEQLELSEFTENLVFVEGIPEGYVDDDSWVGWTLEAGTYSYTNTLGARCTVRKYTVEQGPKIDKP